MYIPNRMRNMDFQPWTFLKKTLSRTLLGMVNLQFFDIICTPTDNLHHQAGKLSESDMSILRAYSFKVDEHIMDKAFAKIPHAFPSDPVPSIDICKSQVQFLSGLKPERYDCCINSCCCFTGRHKDCMKCPYCGED